MESLSHTFRPGIMTALTGSSFVFPTVHMLPIEMIHFANVAAFGLVKPLLLYQPLPVRAGQRRTQQSGADYLINQLMYVFVVVKWHNSGINKEMSAQVHI
jgi:hypothetical protein